MEKNIFNIILIFIQFFIIFDKLKYYKNLGKKHSVDLLEDSSTEYESSSDDFPSPPKRKKDKEKEELQKRIQELEKMINKKK